MSREITSTMEEVQTATKTLQQLQFQKEQLDRQYSIQFDSLFVPISSLPNSEMQNFLYGSLYGNDCSLKRKRENEEDQNFNSNRRYRPEFCIYNNNNNNNNNSTNNNFVQRQNIIIPVFILFLMLKEKRDAKF
jgi:hypothetical protein